jgi:hypothetical protein
VDSRTGLRHPKAREIRCGTVERQAVVLADTRLNLGARLGLADDGRHMALPAMIRELWDTLGEYPAEVLGFAIVQLLIAAYALAVL